METKKITFVHDYDDDYLTNTILFIRTSGCITQMEEFTVKYFINIWKDVFNSKVEGRDLESLMKEQQTAVIHSVSYTTYNRNIWTFINSEGNQLTFNLN